LIGAGCSTGAVVGTSMGSTVMVMDSPGRAIDLLREEVNADRRGEGDGRLYELA
jgi:hypothetical protein